MSTTRSRSQRNAPTIADVASHAGVSPMSVSRVINGETSVRPAIREKVEAAIAALNYAPSAAARQLAGGEETRIALVHANPSSAYLYEFLTGSLDRASALNLQLTVEKLDEAAGPAEMIAHMRRGRVSGIVLPPPLCESGPMLAALSAAGIPVVAVAAGVPRPDIASVSIDDFRAAEAMTHHLVELGHRRIGFIRGNPDQSASERRYAGYCAALEQAGLTLDPAIVAQGYFTYRSGLDAAGAILDAREPPTAIFASNDDMAAATVAVAHARHLDVPGDLTVCGFDDTPLATTIWPELTTIRQPIGDMARRAVDLLVRQLRGKRPDGTAAHELLDFELIRRQSDAAPRGRH
ncbi:LacI family DNA-binding transcriptional regulator [Novosphingobium flavum]|uniref:LacI family DNA-binding transcriptional regulator n=1 Tax=Novosphingobium flavum TaxID=1778672 RepID=A0A7X1KN58_9SPHN|nr:LacI family DNA-binding transcriptional regulator [Novosphingobium flavum]MBC2667302.1 LacI family DNA-binding transcriptional regulator [Novosphingobium flavum]